ncbi:MAG: hypothetical protein ACLTMP_05040 [Eggerthella lenta]
MFSDAALRDMCAKRPTTDEEFLRSAAWALRSSPVTAKPSCPR